MFKKTDYCLPTELSMASMRRRKSPKQDATEHAIECVDKTAELEVKYINAFKGMESLFPLKCICHAVAIQVYHFYLSHAVKSNL